METAHQQGATHMRRNMRTARACAVCRWHIMQYAHAQSVDGTMLDKPKIINNNNNNNKAFQQQSTVNIKITILKQLGLNINIK